METHSGHESPQSEGPATDRNNTPVVDPTENVKSLSIAANKRQDDLREAERRYNEARLDHEKELSQIRAEHQKELSAKESSRLDSIRQIDREEVKNAAITSQTAIATLATQTTTLAETLRNQVANTAALAEQRRQVDMGEINKRLSALELALSANAGKLSGPDPQTEHLLERVHRIEQAQTQTGGERRGISQSWGLLVAGLGALGTVLVIFTFFSQRSVSNAAQQPNVVYVPVPAGAANTPISAAPK